jgi:hypothetical protein
MTTIVEQVYAELLRYVYAFSTSRWSAVLTHVSLAGLAAMFFLAAIRIRNASGRAPRPAAQRRASS